MDENTNEIELLRIENKDLMAKLETLKQKGNDHYPEYERNIAELETLREFKIKLIEINSKLQRQLQEKEKELVELSKINEEKLERLSELEEQLEMATIEKEMAEEKAGILEAEIEIEKQRVQELEIQLDLFRNEIESRDDIPQVGTPEMVILLKDDGIQFRMLECQNMKLREAVVRMRDAIGQLAEEKRELSQENETLKNDSVALVKICENLKNELQKADQRVLILKERIDATAESEKMIEILTVKNMDLEKKLRKICSTLEEMVEDYEAIRSMDEEILETQRESEKELGEELDLTNNRISSLLVQIKTYGEQIDEYEKTIIKFRRKIDELNEEIQGKQDEIISLNEHLKGGEDSNAISAQSTHITTATRTFAEVVDKEVYALELKYEIELTNHLKAFLPDNFTKPGGDGDAVLLTVRCSRLSAKTTLLAKLLSLKYPYVPGGIRREHVTKSHKAEQWAHCAKFSFFLSSFVCALRQCEREYENTKSFSVLRRCTVELLSRLALLQCDIGKEEKMIDQCIDLLRNDKFDENTPIDGVTKAVNHLESLAIDSSTDEYMKSVLKWVERCEQLCMRLKNRISACENFIFTQDLEIQLATWNTSFKNVASVFDNLCSITNIQLSTITGILEAEGLEENCIQEALFRSVEKVHGPLNGAEATRAINEYMRVVQNIITDLINKFDNVELLNSPIDKSFSSPLMERANARKQDALEAEKLRWNLEKKENEMMELKINLRAKLDDISNYRVRLEMAESKIESMEKIDETEVQKLCLQNEDLRDQLRKAKMEYKDTLETLQREIDVCEKENCELRNRATTISKKVLLHLQTLKFAMNHSKMEASVTPNDSNPPTPQQFNELACLENELKETKLALSWAYQRIRLLKANERLQMLDVMDPVTIPSDICGPLTLLSVRASMKDELDELYRRAESILASKTKQDLAKRKHLGDIAHINQRIADLKIDIHRFCNRFHQGGKWPSLFENIESVTSNNRKKEKRIAEIDRHSKGVHSVAYKNAFQSLFGNLNVEQKRTESMVIAVTV